MQEQKLMNAGRSSLKTEGSDVALDRIRTWTRV
jgi:hypothetical protein